MKILLLEPDRQIANDTKTSLMLAGYSVITHTDLQAAILSVDKFRPDLVILDLLLGGRSAIEFLYELRSYPEWQDIKVILTGRYPLEEIETYLASLNQLNIAAYLPKLTASLDNFHEIIAQLHPASV